MYSQFAETNEINILLFLHKNREEFKIVIEELDTEDSELWNEKFCEYYKNTISKQKVVNKVAHALHDVNLSAFPTKIVGLYDYLVQIDDITLEEIIAEYKQIAAPERKDDYFI